VLPAALDGRVGTLMVSDKSQRWGRFDSQRRQTVIHDARADEDEELVNVAAVLTLRNGGSVVPFASGRLPGDAPIAAIYRW